MATADPMNAGLPPPPAVSKRTILMAGILVDVFGLDELSASRSSQPRSPQPAPPAVSCLWLHHGRTGSKDDMTDFACRAVDAWARREEGGQGRSGGGGGKGLIVAAFDQRNHGSRLVDASANESWQAGNHRHAIDMFGTIAGMVSDTRNLMDVVEGYLFPEAGLRIDQHLVLGVSLGGHSAWQLMFAEPRVRAGVVIIGCPDYMYLMKDRARKSKRSTYSLASDGADFLGSADFPPDLVSAALRHDPRGVIFGTDPVPAGPEMSPSSIEKRTEELRRLLDLRVRGKRFLVCSGAADRLVPYANSAPFLAWFEEAARTWYADGGVEVENKVYEGIGHKFSAGMVTDAVRFVLRAAAGEHGDEGRSKI